MTPSPHSRYLEYTGILLGLGLVFYFLMGRALQAEFALVDDHQIYNIITSHQANMSGIWAGVVSNTLEGGRVRPGYSVLYHTETALFGDSPALWHAAFWGYGILSGFLFYLAARKAGGDILSAAFFVLLLSFSGRQNSVWYRLGTGETWGVLFLAGAVSALVLAARRKQANFWDGVALTFIFLMGTPKESFALVIPALLLLRVGLHRRWHQEPWTQTLRRLKVPLTAGFVIFIIQITAIGLVMYLKPNQYGAGAAGLSAQSFSPLVWLRVVAEANLGWLGGGTLLSGITLGYFALKERWLAWYGPLLLLGAAWVLPQLILYSNGINGHYIFPLVIGPAAVVGLTLTFLRQRNHRAGWIIFTLLTILIIGRGALLTVEHTGAYTANTQALQKMVRYLAKRLPAEQAVVIIANPTADYENVLSLRTHLRYHGMQSPVYLLPAYQHPAETETALARQLLTVDFAGLTEPNQLTGEQVGAIIALASPSGLTSIPAWYQPGRWQEQHFSSPFYKVSWSPTHLFQQTQYTYFTLIPQE